MKRDRDIDNLRGFAIILMILTHSLVPYLSEKNFYSIWNWSHFSVPLFIFSSIIIFFAKPPDLNWKNILGYIKKRFKRLLVPYYIFVAIYFFCRYFLFTHKLEPKYILSSIYFAWGDSAWLVLLFLYLSILSPLLFSLKKKHTLFFYLYGVVCIVSTIYFSRNNFNDYRIIMWLPWSIFLFFCYYFIKLKDNKKSVFFLFITSGILFIFLSVFGFYRNDYSLYDNKYPPDIYYLSFGLVLTSFLYLISSKGFFKKMRTENILAFFSRNSYTLFFIQFLMLDIFKWTKFHEIFSANTWLAYFFVILGTSCFLQFLLNKTLKFITKHR